MRRPVIIAVAIVFALALLARTMTYTVKFTENAVLTTFGKAGANAIQTKPGLKFKWPDPIQAVTKYDTRSRFLQTQSQTQQTADSRQLVVETFCTWRVSDPLKFFQRFSNAGDNAQDHYKAAEDRVLRGNLRSAMGEISRYRIGELFTTDTTTSKLTELEARILATLKTPSQEGTSIADYGIEVEVVGINRIMMPEETTKAVFDSMKEDRAFLVKGLESKGDSEAQTIIGTADANARRIEAFAKQLAADIRQKGDQEAQPYIVAMQEAPELAVFLKNIDFMKQALGKRMTWIVDTSMPGMELLSPTAVRNAKPGTVPGVSGLMAEVNKTPETKESKPTTIATPGQSAPGGRP